MKDYIPALILLASSIFYFFFFTVEERFWQLFAIMALADAYITFKIRTLTNKEVKDEN